MNLILFIPRDLHGKKRLKIRTHKGSLFGKLLFNSRCGWMELNWPQNVVQRYPWYSRMQMAWWKTCSWDSTFNSTKKKLVPWEQVKQGDIHSDLKVRFSKGRGRRNQPAHIFRLVLLVEGFVNYWSSVDHYVPEVTNVQRYILFVWKQTSIQVVNLTSPLNCCNLGYRWLLKLYGQLENVCRRFSENLRSLNWNECAPLSIATSIIVPPR